MCLIPLVLVPPVPPSSQPCFLAVIMSPCCRHVFSQHSRLHNTAMSPSKGVWAWFTYGTCILVWRNKTLGLKRAFFSCTYVQNKSCGNLYPSSIPLMYVVMNPNSDSCLDSWLGLVVGLSVTGSVACNGWFSPVPQFVKVIQSQTSRSYAITEMGPPHKRTSVTV